MDQDELLVKRAQNGSQDAFRQIVEKYKSFIFAICMNIARDPQEAENLSQETFIQIYRSLGKYESRGFKTWIGRIATNKAIDWKRKHKQETLNKVIYLDDADVLNMHEEDRLYEHLAKKEDREKLFKMFEALPEMYSTVLKKYYMQSKSYQEISIEEGISLKTVESRLYRAKKAIRKKWEEDEHAEAF
ncbi:MAG: RNA polymerase sigma factor [Clostridia bacterium]|nr:RNA polymerase sigma factor [Clostridia bacterium]